jgi:hypothetical protein
VDGVDDEGSTSVGLEHHGVAQSGRGCRDDCSDGWGGGGGGVHNMAREGAATPRKGWGCCWEEGGHPWEGRMSLPGAAATGVGWRRLDLTLT